MGNDRTYRVSTLGCRVNRADSMAIERQLAVSGYRRAAPDKVPSVWVVNTCAVTNEGMRKSRKLARKCVRSGAEVVVTGCAVDMDPGVFQALDIGAVVSNRDKEQLVEVVCSLSRESEGYGADVEAWMPEELVRVPVKVQDGCERYCSYCIVPYLRPAPSSKPLESVLEEVRLLRSLGTGEVVLCGIDLGAYREPETGGGLTELLEAVIGEAQNIWVRLSSIEISDVGEELVTLISRKGSLCRHLHLPLQSGDARVLADMRRESSPRAFGSRVEQIREKIPDVSFTTDVMVGFPTEDEPAFRGTMHMLDSIGFSRVHVFKYSGRSGTAAFALGDPVDPGTKQRRAEEVRSLANAMAQRFHAGFVGRIMPVLVEAKMGDEPGHVFGRTQSFSGVILEGGEELIGKLVEVEITSAGEHGLKGQPVQASMVKGRSG